MAAFPKLDRFLECPLTPQSPPLGSGAPNNEIGQLFSFDSGLISTSWPAFNWAIQRIEEACHRAFPMKLSNQQICARSDGSTDHPARCPKLRVRRLHRARLKTEENRIAHIVHRNRSHHHKVLWRFDCGLSARSLECQRTAWRRHQLPFCIASNDISESTRMHPAPHT